MSHQERLIEYVSMKRRGCRYTRDVNSVGVLVRVIVLYLIMMCDAGQAVSSGEPTEHCSGAYSVIPMGP